MVGGGALRGGVVTMGMVGVDPMLVQLFVDGLDMLMLVSDAPL